MLNLINTTLVTTFIGAVSFSSAAQAGGVVKFLAASSKTKSPLENLIRNDPVAFLPPIHKMKLSVIFDKPLPISRVTLQSCDKEWEDGIEMFTMPGLTRAFSEGGKSQIDFKVTAAETRSLAIVFGKDAQLCLRSLVVYDQKNLPIALVAPTSIAATLSEESAATLFDSHPETKAAIEDPLTVTFSGKQKFDRALISTGGTALYAHSLKLSGGKGWKETLPLRSTSAEQEIVFKKPFIGDKLTITAPSGGEVGEIRFADGTKVQNLNVASVAAPKFANVFDSTWITDASSEDHWTFVFRADGTFFVKGLNDDPKQAREYAGVGGYTVTRQAENELRLKINGVRFPTALKWDGVMCPFTCGNEGSSETPLADSLVLELAHDGTMMVRNRTPRAHRTLTFGDLKLHRPSDD